MRLLDLAAWIAPILNLRATILGAQWSLEFDEVASGANAEQPETASNTHQLFSQRRF